MAGKIEAVGRDVTRFRPGDQVYGKTGLSGLGTYAKSVCLPEGIGASPLPSGPTYAVAAAIPNGALTALPFLRDTVGRKPGQTVVIMGASGAVGSSAVHPARDMGARVTGDCSAASLDLVKSLGAEAAVDGSTADFTQNELRYDIVLDTVGKSSHARCRRSLTDQEVFLTTVLASAGLIRRLWKSLFGGQKLSFATTGCGRPVPRQWISAT